MSVSDPRGRGGYGSPATDESGRRLTELSNRLSEARRNGEPAPEELERLVAMIAGAEIESGDRLANALEGLARWADSAKSIAQPAESPRAQPAPPAQEPPEVEARLTAFAKTLTEQPAPTPAQSERTAAPIASLRAALAEIADRQRALDAADEEPARWRSAPVRQQETTPPPAPSYAAAPSRTEPEFAPRAELPRVDPGVVHGMREEIERLGRTVEALPTRSEIEGLAGEMAALANRLGADRPARLDAESLKAIESLVAQVDRMRGDAASPQMIAELSEELKAIAARLDVLGPRSTTAIEALERRIEEIRAELNHFPRIGAVDRLAVDIQSVVARLDAQERDGGPALKALDDKIEAMAVANRARSDEFDRMNESFRSELETLPRAADMTDLGRQIDALTEGLKVRQGPAPAVTAFKDLSGKVDALDGKIDAIAAAAKPVALDTLGRQIEELTQHLVARREEPAPVIAEDLARRFDSLGERMDDMTAAARARSGAFDRVEDAVRTIADRLASHQPAQSAAALSGDLDAQITRLVEGFERNDGRLDDLGAAFAGLASRIEQTCSKAGAEAARSAVASAREAFSAAPSEDVGGELAHALAELRHAASQTERRTADTLEAVRATLERLLERIEDGPSASPQRAPSAEPLRTPPAEDRAAASSQPAATEAARAAARRALAEIGSAEPEKPSRFGRAEPEPPSFQPIAELAPDHPLEPGSAPQARPDFGAQPSGMQTAAELIAAARRAQIQPTVDDEPIAPSIDRAVEPRAPRAAGRFAALKTRKRPILLAAAATLIAIAALYVASTMTGSQPELAPEPGPAAGAPPATAPQPQPGPADSAPAAPKAPERKSELDPAASPQPSPASPEPAGGAPAQPASPQSAANGMPSAFADAEPTAAPSGQWKIADPVVTGSIARGSDALPDSIGSSTLRLRAVSGDPSAQLEIADRLLEGRGVSSDPEAAARWLEKAATQGLAPAQQRLGSLYEKGRGVTRDIVTARRWYEQAAASGNVRAMHNLGVIHAEGGLGKPDYNAAIVWFRMAAERGLVDSEYNLAVLCARGLGGKRDLTEAYKWFALASAQGDEDAGKKRDEVGKALGAALPAAKAAVDAFRARPVDSAANDAPTPPGGWDQASAKPADGARKTR